MKAGLGGNPLLQSAWARSSGFGSNHNSNQDKNQKVEELMEMRLSMIWLGVLTGLGKSYPAGEKTRPAPKPAPSNDERQNR
jgi:hypothetical protein